MATNHDHYEVTEQETTRDVSPLWSLLLIPLFLVLGVAGYNAYQNMNTVNNPDFGIGGGPVVSPFDSRNDATNFGIGGSAPSVSPISSPTPTKTPNDESIFETQPPTDTDIEMELK